MANVDSKISDLVAHLPEWLRHDLVASNQAIRVRAEETLAAMIANVGSTERLTVRSGWVPPTQAAQSVLN